MIPKMTSNELNNILNNANEKLDDLVNTIQSTKNNINQKLKIMRYESEFIEEQIEYINNSNNELEENKIIMFNEKLQPINRYGNTATANFKSNIVNVFNIKSIDTNEAFYRDIASVTINGITNDSYKDILKHDSIIAKQPLFIELDNSDTVNISIVLDSTKTLGRAVFNMIEIDPFLNGSFDITSIKIYSSQNKDLYEEHKNYNNVGKTRLTFDKEYEFNRIDISIKVNYYSVIDNKRIYPFGLKHIYFCKAQYDINSYGIIVIEKPDFIDTIEDYIYIKTPNEIIETTIKNENIELYLNCKINNDNEIELTNPQEPSTTQNIKPIGINVKKIYAKMPIKNKSLIGVNFKTTSKNLSNL